MILLIFNQEKIGKKFFHGEWRKLQVLTDLLFFVYLFVEIIHLSLNKKAVKKYIYLLSFVCSIYISFNYLNISILKQQNCFITHIFEYLKVFINKYTISEQEEKFSLMQRIILCKKVSRTRKKGRISRYVVSLIVFSSSGSWFGLGKAKDFHLQDTIYKARVNALKNIFSLIIDGSVFKEREFDFFIRRTKLNSTPSPVAFIRTIIEAFKTTDVSMKKGKKDNIFSFLI